jgi:hypothetical protein
MNLRSRLDRGHLSAERNPPRDIRARWPSRGSRFSARYRLHARRTLGRRPTRHENRRNLSVKQIVSCAARVGDQHRGWHAGGSAGRAVEAADRASHSTTREHLRKARLRLELTRRCLAPGVRGRFGIARTPPRHKARGPSEPARSRGSARHRTCDRWLRANDAPRSARLEEEPDATLSERRRSPYPSAQPQVRSQQRPRRGQARQ